jgi:hypothetical protein
MVIVCIWEAYSLSFCFWKRGRIGRADEIGGKVTRVEVAKIAYRLGIVILEKVVEWERRMR